MRTLATALVLTVFGSFVPPLLRAEPPVSANDGASLEELQSELAARDRHYRSRGATPGAKGVAVEEPVAHAAEASEATRALSFDELVDRVVAGQKAIYGDDDRREPYEVLDEAIVRNSRAVVAVFQAESLVRQPDGSWSLRPTEDEFGAVLCSSERFATQPHAALCSGFLVAPDVVATAGHCVADDKGARALRFVFDFELTQSGTREFAFPTDTVYEGAKLIDRRLSVIPMPQGGGRPGEDWALVRLDRPVLSREPALLGTGEVAPGTKVYMIGHPSGLPKKITPNGVVLRSGGSTFFATTLDAFHGNSGAMVVSADSHAVEGILVRGESDYAQGPTCARAVRCPPGGALQRCSGEHVARITPVVKRVKPAPKAEPAP